MECFWGPRALTWWIWDSDPVYLTPEPTSSPSRSCLGQDIGTHVTLFSRWIFVCHSSCSGLLWLPRSSQVGHFSAQVKGCLEVTASPQHIIPGPIQSNGAWSSSFENQDTDNVFQLGCTLGGWRQILPWLDLGNWGWARLEIFHG